MIGGLRRGEGLSMPTRYMRSCPSRQPPLAASAALLDLRRRSPLHCPSLIRHRTALSLLPVLIDARHPSCRGGGRAGKGKPMSDRAWGGRVDVIWRADFRHCGRKWRRRQTWRSNATEVRQGFCKSDLKGFKTNIRLQHR